MKCKESCGNCSNGEPCHHVDGSCPSGCDVGVYGKTCDEGIVLALWYGLPLTDSTCKLQHKQSVTFPLYLACQSGRYGINCAKACGENCQSCNRFNGVCEFGCHPGWKGTFCKKRSNYVFRFFFCHITNFLHRIYIVFV